MFSQGTIIFLSIKPAIYVGTMLRSISLYNLPSLSHLDSSMYTFYLLCPSNLFSCMYIVYPKKIAILVKKTVNLKKNAVFLFKKSFGICCCHYIPLQTII